MKAFGLVFDDIIIFQMTIVLRFSAPLRDRGAKNKAFFYFVNRDLWYESNLVSKVCILGKNAMFMMIDCWMPK
jgi:hypothetical protein